MMVRDRLLRLLQEHAKSSDPVDTLHGDQVVLEHVNNPESAHAQTVILTAVKALRRTGI
jgi:hypothetical protein